MNLIAPVTQHTVQLTVKHTSSIEMFATVAKVSLIVAVFGLLVLVISKSLEKNRIKEIYNGQNEGIYRALTKSVIEIAQVAVPVLVAFSTQSTVPCISAVILVGNYLLS